MKRLLFSTVLILFIFTITRSQDQQVPRTEEYSMIRAIFYYKTGTLVSPSLFDKKPNPILYMGDKSFSIKNDLTNKPGTDFNTITEICDYMNSYGWTLVTSNISEYLGEGTSTDETILNTNKYIQLLFFKKEIKSN